MERHTMEGQGGDSGLWESLAVLRRRKWLALLVVVASTAAAVGLSLLQSPLYEASAEVLLSRQNLAATLTGTPDASLSLQAERVTDTQARLARVPQLARRVLADVGLPGRAPAVLLENSSVSAPTNTDVLLFTVRDGDPATAVALATAYAREYTAYRRELDTAAIARARRDVRARLTALEREGQRRSALYASLADKEQQLSTLEALQTSNAFVVREAEGAPKVRPRTVRNGALGFVLGVGFAVAAAFLRDALDRRIRTADEVASRLGLPVLAHIPPPSKRMAKHDHLAMLVEPSGGQAESFRMLRTNLDFACLDRDIRTILVTSAVEREGKSTTAANLAVALARAGRRVVLVDLDLRRPYVDRFFAVGGAPGVTQVVLGYADLGRALHAVPVAQFDRLRATRAGRRLNGGDQGGSLLVLPAGALPPDPGEFVASKRLAGVLEALRERVDVVIVDSPPLLQVGDAMTLSTQADAVLLVARINLLRRPMLAEVRRLLESSPASALGIVATGVETGSDYGYGYTNGYAAPERPRASVENVGETM